MKDVRSFGTWAMAGTAGALHLIFLVLVQGFDLVFMSWSAILLWYVWALLVSLILSAFIATVTPRKEKAWFYTASTFTIIALSSVAWSVLAYVFNSMGWGVSISP